MSEHFVLIHSPLVGMLTWQAVAQVLEAQGHHAFVVELQDDSNNGLPVWKQEVDSVSINAEDVILVGHSGAGSLMPAIAEKSNIKGMIFVDAVLAFNDISRLGLLDAEDSNFAQEFEKYLQNGGQFPNWTDDQLKATIPGDELRQQLIADLRPRKLDFFTETIEVSLNWDAKPCAYIQLSETYDYYLKQAEARNWPVLRHDSHHFEMLTNPDKIAQLLIEISEKF